MNKEEKLQDFLEEAHATAIELTDDKTKQIAIMGQLRRFYHMGISDTKEAFSYSYNEAQTKINRIGFGAVRKYMEDL